jgi:hypothetical protein
VPTAAKPAATAASLATRFKVEVLGRMDFFDFVGRLAFVVLLVFDLLPACFRLVFDLTRRFDEVLDLVRFFAFFMLRPIRFKLSSHWASIRLLASRRGWFPASYPGRINPEDAATRTACWDRGEIARDPHCMGLATARVKRAGG